jgi:hypothetical protein
VAGQEPSLQMYQQADTDLFLQERMHN